MASEWTTIRAADFIEFNPRLSIKKNAIATKVAMDNPYQRNFEGKPKRNSNYFRWFTRCYR